MNIYKWACPYCGHLSTGERNEDGAKFSKAGHISLCSRHFGKVPKYPAKDDDYKQIAEIWV